MIQNLNAQPFFFALNVWLKAKTYQHSIQTSVGEPIEEALSLELS